MVHAKTCVIDDEWSTVGTANLDRWSMIGNFEINLEIRSRHLAQQMIEMFEFDMRSCRELDLSGWRSRPMGRQMSEKILSSLSPLM
jgi:cardiolipin synthase